jgi:class 3 adenylate cyclase
VRRIPETHYTQVGDADVAYQVAGEGPVDLLFFNGLGAHVDLSWDPHICGGFYARLQAFSRLITFDRRGTGASDGVPRGAIPTWEEWTEDVRAVLDAAGSTRAAVVAHFDAGPIAVLFAVTHPERVNALVLIESTARFLVADDYPIGWSPEMIEALILGIPEIWGTPALAQVVPSLGDDTDMLDAITRQLRAAATPRTAAAQCRYMYTSLDVRSALPLVQAPTLVLNWQSNALDLSIDHGMYVADHIAGARFTELASTEPFISRNNADAIADEIAEFLTGERPPVEIERVLTTVLFTDIVGSTERAASMGDQRWRFLLDTHDRTVRDKIRRFHGREVNTTGDGFVAAFDGPARAIRCATEITDAAQELGVEVRAGLHTGECEVRGEDLGGIAVHIAARVGSLAGPGEVLVSRTVVDLVAGSGIEFDDRGEHELKGVPGRWQLYSVVAG